MGSVASASKSPVDFEWRGKVYRTGVLRMQSVLAELQTWLEKKAIGRRMLQWNALVEAGHRDVAWLEGQLSQFIDEIESKGTYSFGSKAMMAVLSDVHKGDIAEDEAKAGGLDPATFGAKIKLMSLMVYEAKNAAFISEDDVVMMMSEIPQVLSESMARAMSRSYDDPNGPGDAQPPIEAKKPAAGREGSRVARESLVPPLVNPSEKVQVLGTITITS